MKPETRKPPLPPEPRTDRERLVWITAFLKRSRLY